MPGQTIGDVTGEASRVCLRRPRAPRPLENEVLAAGPGADPPPPRTTLAEAIEVLRILEKTHESCRLLPARAILALVEVDELAAGSIAKSLNLAAAPHPR